MKSSLARRTASTLIGALAAFAFSAIAQAHPISLVQADVFVAPEKMTAKFEVFLEDLYFFHGLEADADNRLAADDLRRAAKSHAAFLAERFTIRRTDGSPYEPTAAKLAAGEIPEEGVALGDLMKSSLTYEIAYAVAEAPEYLTLEQRFVGEDFRVPSNVTLRIWQEGAEDPLAVQTLSPRRPFSVRIDWSNPNPPAIASIEAWDAWTESRRKSTLGISSYSSTYTFLYVEPDEVRHEILVPLLSLETDEWRVPRADPDQLAPAEQEAAHDLIVERFEGRVPLHIDGTLREPIVDRVDFYGIDFSDFALRAPKRTVGAASARVGIILRYPCETPPTSVELEWKLFDENLFAVQTVAFAPDSSYDVEFSSVDPDHVFRWDNPSPGSGDLPPAKTFAAPPLPSSTTRIVVTLVGLGLAVAAALLARSARHRSPALVKSFLGAAAILAISAVGWSYWKSSADRGAARLPDAEALEVAQALHAQVYDAFRIPDEDARYERLDASLSGDLVREAYLEISDRLRMEDQGGAALRIEEVTPIQGRVSSAEGFSSDPRAFVIEGEWTVSGRVEHWGHVHTRTNAYDGRALVEPRDGVWKIARLELLGDERIESKTTLRKF